MKMLRTLRLKLKLFSRIKKCPTQMKLTSGRLSWYATNKTCTILNYHWGLLCFHKKNCPLRLSPHHGWGQGPLGGNFCHNHRVRFTKGPTEQAYSSCCITQGWLGSYRGGNVSHSSFPPIITVHFSCNSLFVYKYKRPGNGRPEGLDIQAVLPIYGEFSIVMSQIRHETLALRPTLSSTSLLDQPRTGW